MKLIVTIALILLLAAPTLACSEAGAWQDAIARAVARTNAAQSYRATLNTTQDIEGCTTQSSFVMEYSGGDSHLRSTYTTSCQGDSPGEATAASGNLAFTDRSQGWSEWIVVSDTAFIRSSDGPAWREYEVTAGSRPPIAGETKVPSAPPGVPPPTHAPTLAHTPAPPPSPTPQPAPPPTPPPTPPPAPPPAPPPTPPPAPPPTPHSPLGSPRPTSASSAPSPTPLRVLGSKVFITIGSNRTTAPAPTPAFTPSENCFAARLSPAGSLDRLISVERLPDERIDGVPCSHYRGSVDQDPYVDTLIEANRQANGDTSELEPSFLAYLDRIRRREYVVELWIDDEGYIRQHRTDSRGPGLDPDTGEEVRVTIVSTTRYFDFNEPIVIESPDLAAQ